MKRNRLDLKPPPAQHLTCGREDQLDVAGCREQHGAIDPMVLKIARTIRVDFGLPDRLGGFETVPEQRMHRALQTRRAALLRFRPMNLPLPWMAGQFNE